MLLAEIRSLYDKVERYVRALLAVTTEMPKTQREHWAILDALYAPRPDEAASLTRAHVLDGGASLVKYLSEHRADPADSTLKRPHRRLLMQRKLLAAACLTAFAGLAHADLSVAIAGPMTDQYASAGDQIRRAPKWRSPTSTPRAAYSAKAGA